MTDLSWLYPVAAMVAAGAVSVLVRFWVAYLIEHTTSERGKRIVRVLGEIALDIVATAQKTLPTNREAAIRALVEAGIASAKTRIPEALQAAQVSDEALRETLKQKVSAVEIGAVVPQVAA